MFGLPQRLELVALVVFLLSQHVSWPWVRFALLASIKQIRTCPNLWLTFATLLTGIAFTGSHISHFFFTVPKLTTYRRKGLKAKND